MVKVQIISAIILTLLISNCSVKRPSDEVWSYIHAFLNENELTEEIPADKLHNDIDYFMEVLEEVHVNPYLNIQKDRFYSEIGKLKTSIDRPLTRKEFYQIFTPVVLMLKDSHTNTHFPREIFEHYNKNSQEGKILVLINHYSYSATVGFLGAIKDFQIAPIVGTESGESPNGFGEAYYFDLPKSRLLCRSSTTFMLKPNHDPTMTSGIQPDYLVEDNIFTDKDEVMEFALQLSENI